MDRSHPALMRFRLKEQKRITRHRYGSDQLPDDDAGRDDLYLIANTLASDGGSQCIERIIAYADMHCSWLRSQRSGPRLLPHPDALTLAKRIAANPRRMSADTLAQHYGLTDAQRSALNIRTIGAVDVTKAMREARRKERRRLSETARRRVNGAKPRGIYEASSAAQIKPWLALGISRATWYRLGKPTVRPVRQVRGQCSSSLLKATDLSQASTPGLNGIDLIGQR
jgi:hypothetical protein